VNSWVRREDVPETSVFSQMLIDRDQRSGGWDSQPSSSIKHSCDARYVQFNEIMSCAWSDQTGQETAVMFENTRQV
jgi:hypothetical protein